MPAQNELKQQGNIHFQNDDFEKAIEFYTLAIEKDAFCDEAAPILSNRSLCYYNIGKYKEAYEDAGCCCGIRPDWAKGFARRGAAAEELKEWQIALESYDEYLKLSESDEMGIGIKKRRVKSFVETAQRNEEKRKRELRALEEDLSKMKDVQFSSASKVSHVDVLTKMEMMKAGLPVDASDQKKSNVYQALSTGCEEMNIDKIELAIKHGADLGEHFLSTAGWEKGVVRRDKKSKAISNHVWSLKFTAVDFDTAKNLLASQSGLHRGITTGAKEALNFLLRTSHRSKMSEFEQTDLLIRQRNYFDRLLDLPHQQQEKYVPPPQVTRAMCEICSYDANHHIRDDLVMILLEKGKTYFVGHDLGEKQFKKIFLRCLLIGGSVMAGEDPAALKKKNVVSLLEDSNASGDSSLRKLLECLKTCLKGLTAEDLNSDCDSRVINHLPPFAGAFPLVSAAALHHSPLITQLLLDRGADMALESRVSDPRNTTQVLDLKPVVTGLLLGSMEVARLLLMRGAKLPREKVPEWVHARFVGEKNSDSKMMVPQQDYCPFLRQVLDAIGEFSQSVNSRFSCKNQEIMKEEKLRLIFDAMADQNLCLFVNPHPEHGKIFETPLFSLIRLKASIDLLATVLKIRPKLLYTPTVHEDGYTTLYPFAGLLFELQSGNVSLEYAKNVSKLLMESGLNFFTGVAVFHEDGSSVPASLLCECSPGFKSLCSLPGVTLEPARQMKDLYDYCTDFEKRRGNFE